MSKQSTTDDSFTEPTYLKNATTKRTLKFFVDIVVIILIGLLIAALFKAFVVRSFYIPSESMMPTLNVNDRVLVEQIGAKTGNINNGDIIVFKDNQGWMGSKVKREPSIVEKMSSMVSFNEKADDEYLVKRVIGNSGDHVVCCTDLGQLKVNGKILKEPYINGSVGSVQSFDVTVPKDSVWVMGDNRINSADSRVHQNVNGGFIPYSDIVGRVFVTMYPYNSFEWH